MLDDSDVEENYFLYVCEDGTELKYLERVPGSFEVHLEDGIEDVVTISEYDEDTDLYTLVRPPGRCWELIYDGDDISTWARAVTKRLVYDDDEIPG